MSREYWADARHDLPKKSARYLVVIETRRLNDRYIVVAQGQLLKPGTFRFLVADWQTVTHWADLPPLPESDDELESSER